MQPPAVLGAEQHLGDEAVLEGVGRAPFAGHHRVVAEMPPRVIGEMLRAAIDLPLPAHIERFRVHEEDAAGALAFAIAKRRHVDAFRAAMDGVRARIAGARRDLGGLDDLDDLGLLRVGLGVEDVNARRSQARHNEITALHMGMRRVGAEARRAGVPAEMMQLVAGVRHGDRVDDLRIARRFGIDIHHGDAVRHFPLRIERRHVGDGLGRRLHGKARRRIEARIWCPRSHGGSPVWRRLQYAPTLSWRRQKLAHDVVCRKIQLLAAVHEVARTQPSHA